MLVISPPFKSPAWAIGLFHRPLTLQETVEPPAGDPAISSHHLEATAFGCCVVVPLSNYAVLDKRKYFPRHSAYR